MNPDRRQTPAKWICLLLAAALFVSAALMALHVLPGIHAVTIETAFDPPGRLQVYHSNAWRGGAWREQWSTAPVEVDRRRRKITLHLGHHLPNYLRIDTAEDPGEAKIYRIVLHSRHAPDRALGPGEILQYFAAGKPGVVLAAEADHVVIRSAVTDPYITGRGRLMSRRPLPATVIPLLLAVTLYFGLRRWDWRASRPLVELSAATARDGRLQALEGLRGLAALMVVADHTWGWFRGTGTTGVWIFFALSGFLLPRPYVTDSRRALSAEATIRYFSRRLARILPVYYVYIFIIYGLKLRFNEALLHLLFLQGDGHLWAIPQIMLFYLLLPGVLVVNHLLFGNRPALAAVATATLAMAANRFLDPGTFGMRGQDYILLRPYLGVFLAGTAFSYLYFGVLRNAKPEPALPFPPAAGIATGWWLLVLLVFFSNGSPFGKPLVYTQIHFGAYSFMAALLIFCLAALPDRGPARLLSCTALRAVGMVGFSLYLIHPLVLLMVRYFVSYYLGRPITGAPLFIATTLLCLPLAAFTWTHLEYRESPPRSGATATSA